MDENVMGILEYIVEKSSLPVELRYCYRNMLTLELVNESLESDISSHEGVSVRDQVD